MGLGDFLGNVFGSHTDEVKPIVNPYMVQSQNIALDPQALAQQQQYAEQVKGMMNGAGPSLATTMLQNQAQQNAGNAMGIAAAQRGVNPGLAMTQALHAAGQGNQQAAQQAAQARVGEQLGATGMYGNQVNQMQAQNVGVQHANQAANLAAQQGNQQAQGQANQINSGIATGNTATNNQVTGGIMNSAGSALSMLALSKGGVVPHPSRFPQYLAGGGFSMMGTQPGQTNPYAGGLGFGPPGMGKKPAGAGGLASDQDWANAMSYQPGTLPNADQTASMMGTGGFGGGEAAAPGFLAALGLKSGGQVPGKATVKGDSYANDVVPTMLSPGELVIPRSVSTAPGFIEALKKHVEKMEGDGPQGFAKVLAARKGRA